MELLLVVWVDEPKGALANVITDFGNQSFKALDGHPRVSYAHQLANVTCRGSACLQQVFVERFGQQMDERKFGGKANANLLMTAERVLPSRKAEENNAVLFEKRLNVKKKASFTFWFDMLYYIVNKYEVIPFILRPWLF